DEPDWEAVLRFERLAVHLVGDERVRSDVRQRKVFAIRSDRRAGELAGICAVAPEVLRARYWSGGAEHIGESRASPKDVGDAPRGLEWRKGASAALMNGDQLDLRISREILEPQSQRTVDQPVNRERPFFLRQSRDAQMTQDGRVLR